MSLKRLERLRPWKSDAEGRAKLDARAENNEYCYFMKTTTDGGNVINAGAINDLELCRFSAC